METTELPPDDRPPVAGPRRVNRGLVWAAALAVVVLAVATVVAFVAGDGGGDQSVVKLDPNGVAPSDGDLNGTDVTGEHLPTYTYTTFDGTTVPLATGGKPMVLNFWASTCGPCVVEMPDLESTYQANQQRIGYLGLQVAESPDLGRDMIARTGISYPVGRDPSGAVFQGLGGVGLPRTVIIRADGTIAYVHSGALSAEDLQQAIDEHAAG